MNLSSAIKLATENPDQLLHLVAYKPEGKPVMHGFYLRGEPWTRDECCDFHDGAPCITEHVIPAPNGRDLFIGSVEGIAIMTREQSASVAETLRQWGFNAVVSFDKTRVVVLG